jgi:hypothetical protein
MPYKITYLDKPELVITEHRFASDRWLVLCPEATSIYIPRHRSEWRRLWHCKTKPALIRPYNSLPPKLRDDLPEVTDPKISAYVVRKGLNLEREDVLEWVKGLEGSRERVMRKIKEWSGRGQANDGPRRESLSDGMAERIAEALDFRVCAWHVDVNNLIELEPRANPFRDPQV